MHTLLVVEYRKNLQTLYENELREEGYRLVVAENEKEAIYILMHECPDLIMVSGEVVFLAGITFLEKIKRYCPNIMILVNTADFRACENLLRSSAVGTSCIVKSSDLDLLKKKIKDTLANNSGSTAHCGTR